MQVNTDCNVDNRFASLYILQTHTSMNWSNKEAFRKSRNILSTYKILHSKKHIQSGGTWKTTLKIKICTQNSNNLQWSSEKRKWVKQELKEDLLNLSLCVRFIANICSQIYYTIIVQLINPKITGLLSSL